MWVPGLLFTIYLVWHISFDRVLSKDDLVDNKILSLQYWGLIYGLDARRYSYAAFLYLISVPDFVKYLGQTSQCKVDETPKGWFRATSHTSQESWPWNCESPKAVPRHFQNHVVWSRTLKCSVKSYVTQPLNQVQFRWLFYSCGLHTW